MAITSGGPSSSVSLFDLNRKEGSEPSSSLAMLDQIHLPELGSEPFFSPQSNFLVTWSHFRKATEAGDSKTKNLRVWKIDQSNFDQHESFDGRQPRLNLFTSFTSKTFNERSLQFSSDDKCIFRLLTNEIQVMEALVDHSTLSAADRTVSADSLPDLTRIGHKGVTRFQISSMVDIDASDVINVASFAPEFGETCLNYHPSI